MLRVSLPLMLGAALLAALSTTHAFAASSPEALPASSSDRHGGYFNDGAGLHRGSAAALAAGRERLPIAV